MKILVFGLPTSGKTYLAKRLSQRLDCAWYNADLIRKLANDWDFSDAGRLRQSRRMNTFASFESLYGRTVICDFICPTTRTRAQFDADISIWMNTTMEGPYQNTNILFEKPTKCTFEIKEYMDATEVDSLTEKIKEKIECLTLKNQQSNC